MSPGAKVFLALVGAGVVFGGLALAAGNANAAPAPPKPKPNPAPPDVVVPPSEQPPAVLPPVVPSISPPIVPPAAPPSVPPFFPPLPLPAVPPPAAPPATPPPANVPPVPGTTFNLPNPLGGPPLGTYNPTTGNVFGPLGTIIGTFDPTTGIFTAVTGQQIRIPGFGPVAAQPLPQNVPAPVPPVPAALPPLPTAPPIPAQPPLPPAAPPAAPAPVTTLAADTAAMVTALLAQEAISGWNKKDPNVTVFQQNRPPLVVDGEYGVNSALAAAKEIGVLPLIRFWPKGSQKASALSAYQTALLELANQSADPTRAAQLRHSASREQAQAFGVTTAKAIDPANQVALAQV